MQIESTELSSEPFVLPASFAQQRMWFLNRLESPGLYNVPWTRRLRGPLDVHALERAFEALITRHESLRTVFTLLDGVPHQVIRPPRPFSLEVIDVADAPDPERRALGLAEDNARAGFDLGSEEPVRVHLIRLGDDDHVLSATLHHIVTDAWSMSVFSRELSTLYRAFLDGGEPELPELPIQYADYAVWQQQWLESGGLDQQLEYWRRKLADAPALLELPTDRPRPSEQMFAGARCVTMLPPEVARAVQALGEREGATVFMTLLAAFAALLSRYSGQEDVVVATPVANRGRVELEQLIGLFVNTLALRIELDGDISFLELLHQVRETTLEAFTNQDLPFEKLVAELAPERSLGHAPVAQVMFVLQTGGDGSPGFPGLDQERIVTERETAKFDLTLFVGEVPDGLRVAAEYATTLFDEATVARMLEHFGVLLAAALAVPSCPVRRLPMLPDHERDLVVRRFAAPPALAGPERCVHELVDEQVARTPQALAVLTGSAQLTYAQLRARADRLASELSRLAAGPGEVVAIAAERSTEMVVAVLAALKAGCAYVPVDPAYPAKRISFMIADSGARVLLTQSHLLERLPAHEGHTICLDHGVWEPSPPPPAVTPDERAYVIYTSGSTGRPKGVAMSHRPLVNLLRWQRSSLPGAARTLQYAALSFDVAFQELFSTWCSGGTLVLIDETVRRDARALARTLRDQQIERLFLPFVALQGLAEACERFDLEIPSLREVITAGEQLRITAPVRRFFRRHASCVLFNHYGPTETHVVTAFELEGPAHAWPALPPIGRPIAGARTYVLDRYRQPVPIGVTGELYLGGAVLADGYLGREDLTAERFSSDPFDDRPGARMYRTGDLARWLPDGNLTFLGRCDDQVKIRGFRVELGEVEAMLSEHPDVAQAAATLREDHPGDVRLTAYLVPREGRRVDDSDMLAHCRRMAPAYMIPQHFVALDALPLTPSGKLDRRALPAPDGRSRTSSASAAPSTRLERDLAEIWRELLKVGDIGIDDDFFDVGGHSLLAVQLVHEVERRLDRTCTLPMLFRNTTIRTLAAELHAGGVEATEPTILQLASGTGPPLFCICGVHAYQELAEELAPDFSPYGIFLPVEQELLGTGSPRQLSVQEMAARYLEAVRSLQPHGPYLLLGFCFGGILAYEAAQQLRAAGEEVSLLVMLDSTLSSVLNRRRARLASRVKRTALHRSERLPRPVQRQLFGEQWLSETKRLERIRSRIYGRAMRRYRVVRYDGPAVLVKPELSARAYAYAADEAWGWGAHIGQLEVCEVPGAHVTHLKRPNALVLARVLRPHLRAAQARMDPGSR